jgi:hypothetical protein
MAYGFTSFDDEVAASASPDATPLPAAAQVRGTPWPVPADQVSDHSAEGAPWQAAPGTINQPDVPPQGPLWAAEHDAPLPGAVSDHNQQAPAIRHHGGHQAPQAYPGGRPWNIGHPFTLKVRRFIRRLATDRWDDTGKRVSPPDAPSAEVQLYGSQHFTTPRMIGYEAAPLFSWAWAAGQQFEGHPGYYLSVNAGVPDMAPRPQGAVVAQPPDDPFVASSQGARQPGPGGAIDYDLGY